MRQAAFFDDADAGWEIGRPWTGGRLYSSLIEEKFRRSIAGLTDLRGRTALSVCGGSGMDAEFLARAGLRVIVSDLAAAAVARARERARQHDFELLGALVADAEALPFADRSVDLVYVHDGLHHLEDPMVGLAEMARVARVAVSVNEPAQAAATRSAIRLGLAGDVEEAGNPIARLRPAEVAAALEAHGFRVVRAQRYAMVYRHDPGRTFRLLSRQPLYTAARLGLSGFNAVAGRLGNKLTVQAVRRH